jgi:hypothetical protein
VAFRSASEGRALADLSGKVGCHIAPSFLQIFTWQHAMHPPASVLPAVHRP